MALPLEKKSRITLIPSSHQTCACLSALSLICVNPLSTHTFFPLSIPLLSASLYDNRAHRLASTLPQANTPARYARVADRQKHGLCNVHAQKSLRPSSLVLIAGFAPSRPLSLSSPPHYHSITLSHYTLSHYHSITPSHYTLSHYHIITPSHYYTLSHDS